MKIKSAIFDMDGTLVDSLGVWKIIWKKFGERFLGNPDFYPDEETDKLCRTQTAYEDMVYVHAKFGFAKDADELYAIFFDIVTDFYKTKVVPKAGTIKLLDELKANGVHLAVATASPMEWVNIALDNCDLRKYFSVILSCEEVGKNKAFPDVFIETARRLGAEVSETAVFEDSLTALKTAKSAGFHTVGIYDENNYGADEARVLADYYVDGGEPLAKALNVISYFD